MKKNYEHEQNVRGKKFIAIYLVIANRRINAINAQPYSKLEV